MPPQVSTAITDNTLKKEGDTITGNLIAEVTNYTSTPQPISAILVIYDSSSKLVLVTNIDITLEVDDNTVNFTGIKVTNAVSSSYNVKIFIWDSIKNMKPFAEVEKGSIQ